HARAAEASGVRRSRPEDRCGWRGRGPLFRAQAQPPYAGRARRARRRVRARAARLLRRAPRAVPAAPGRDPRRRRAHPDRRRNGGGPFLRRTVMTSLTLFTPAGVLARATPLRRAARRLAT